MKRLKMFWMKLKSNKMKLQNSKLQLPSLSYDNDTMVDILGDEPLKNEMRSIRSPLLQGVVT